jgi:hypothetical protein
MKALSIQQPWAHLIVAGLKPIENRTWTTAYRGPLLIHASQKMCIAVESIEAAFGIKIDRRLLHFGCVIGRVDLVDVIEESDSPWFDGPYGFVLRNPRPIKPRPWRGQLKLFDVTMKIH